MFQPPHSMGGETESPNISPKTHNTVMDKEPLEHNL